ncbi:hypothetical protein DFQ29_003411, partial [Apophysomyces sp. BC1021]
MLNKKHKTSSSGPRAMVPPGDLPVFQWSGNVVDPHKTVFETVKECLDHLEDVVLSYHQEMDNNWFLLLPYMLSLEQCSWFDAHLCPHPERPWSFARRVIIKKSKDLVNLSMSRRESVDHYTDKFHCICREAGWENDRKSQTIYINSLLPELAHHVWLAQVNLPSEQQSNVDHAAAIARSLYGKVVLSQHSYEAQNLIAAGPSGSGKPKGCFKCGAAWSPRHVCEKGKALAICSASIHKNGTSALDPAPQETVPQATLPLDLNKDVEMGEKSLDNAFYNACTL